VKETNLDKAENNKNLHYSMIKNYFIKDSIYKKDSYNLKNIEKIEQELNKLKIWKIYTSILDEILQNDTKISNVVDVGCGIENFIFELTTRKQFKKILLPKYYNDLPQYSINISELNDFMNSNGFTQMLSKGLRTLNKTNSHIVLVYKKNW